MARYKVKPRALFVDDNDDCFDAEYDTQEEEEQEVEQMEVEDSPTSVILEDEANDKVKEKGVHYNNDKEEKEEEISNEMLSVGTLVIIRDLLARKGSQAYIIEPGVSDDGMLRILLLLCMHLVILLCFPIAQCSIY